MSDVFVGVKISTLKTVYERTKNVPFKVAELSVRNRDGILCFVNDELLSVYGISYSAERKKYVVAFAVGADEYGFLFDTLQEGLDNFAFNYELFHYCSLKQLIEISSEQKPATEQKLQS